MTDLVKIKIIEDETNETMALFGSTGVPNEAKFTLEDQITLKALDPISGQKFDGCAHNNSEYYIGVRNKDVLEIRPLSMYRMNPIIEMDSSSEQNLTQTPLTFKEQMEEIKAKFGSRKTQRSQTNKRKFEIQFAEKDMENIELRTKLK